MIKMWQVNVVVSVTFLRVVFISNVLFSYQFSIIIVNLLAQFSSIVLRLTYLYRLRKFKNHITPLRKWSDVIQICCLNDRVYTYIFLNNEIVYNNGRNDYKTSWYQMLCANQQNWAIVFRTNGANFNEVSITSLNNC